ncbi:MAG: hypothetical protein GY762_08455 [Proteobacteria bacterium]|nr:hypothetical protein [Pseudomonadota bacterium]
MKYVSVSWVLLVLSGVCCTPTEPEQPAVEIKPRLAAANPGSGESADMSKPDESPTSAGENIITGKARYDAELGDDQPEEGRVVLLVRENGTVKGTLSLSSVSVALSGIKEGDNVRVWASPIGDSPDGMRRGFLFGRTQKGRYEGFFAISGNGGEPSLEGTWFATGE